MKRRLERAVGPSIKRSLRRAAPAALLLLACCERDEPDPIREAGAGETRALSEAAEMLEEKRHETDKAEAPEERPSPSPTPSA